MPIKKGGFTLFELMIVIVIIAIIYTLFIQNLSNFKTTKKLKLQNLPNYLSKLEFDKEALILCTKECKECSLYLDGNRSDEEIALFKSTPIIYKEIPDDRFEEVEFKDYIDFENGKIYKDICFEYKYDKSGSSSEMIIEHKDRFYTFESYFHEVKEFESLDEASEVFIGPKKMLRD